MKKLLATLIFVSFASSALAATNFTSSGLTLGPTGSTFKTSTQVTLRAAAIATSYAATAQHSSADSTKGGKQYGSTSNESLILTADAVTSGPTAPTDASTLSGF